jgi:hypothetical protein
MLCVKIIPRVCLSVCLSAWNNSFPSGLILWYFIVREFIKILSWKFKLRHYRKKISDTLCTIFLLKLGERPLNKYIAIIFAQDHTVPRKGRWLHGVRMERLSSMRARAQIFCCVSFVQAFVKGQSCYPWSGTCCEFFITTIKCLRLRAFPYTTNIHLAARESQKFKSSLGGSSPLCANYNISIDKVDKTKHNKTLLRYRSQKKYNMFPPFYYKAIIRSDMEN